MYFLSGLTCTDENFIQKAGAQRRAAALGLALIAPDTSPRGLGVPGEADSYDFGAGAGFYLNATMDKWAAWRMGEYVLSELPDVLRTLPGLDADRVRTACSQLARCLAAGWAAARVFWAAAPHPWRPPRGGVARAARAGRRQAGVRQQQQRARPAGCRRPRPRAERRHPSWATVWAATAR